MGAGALATHGCISIFVARAVPRPGPDPNSSNRFLLFSVVSYSFILSPKSYSYSFCIYSPSIPPLAWPPFSLGSRGRLTQQIIRLKSSGSLSLAYRPSARRVARRFNCKHHYSNDSLEGALHARQMCPSAVPPALEPLPCHPQLSGCSLTRFCARPSG